MNFAKWVYRIAGWYGIVVLVPQFFMEERIGREYPPPITHPEFFYGMLGAALAWQLGFLVISRDPVRYRAFMIPTWFEKFIFGVATIVLYGQHRLAGAALAFGLLDLGLGLLFVLSYLFTSIPPSPHLPSARIPAGTPP
jgi:hypothetical protein